MRKIHDFDLLGSYKKLQEIVSTLDEIHDSYDTCDTVGGRDLLSEDTQGSSTMYRFGGLVYAASIVVEEALTRLEMIRSDLPDLVNAE
jgi:hypothetical protein